MLSKDQVSQSEFYMWRAVFAFAFVDQSLSLEEQELLHSYLAKARLSEDQRRVLREDMSDPPNPESMYKLITEPMHKSRFCVLARALAWCEGDLDAQEAKILSHMSCMKSGAEADVLSKSRSEEHLHDFYQHYARSGMVGLVSGLPHQVEMRL